MAAPLPFAVSAGVHGFRCGGGLPAGGNVAMPGPGACCIGCPAYSQSPELALGDFVDANGARGYACCGCGVAPNHTDRPNNVPYGHAAKVGHPTRPESWGGPHFSGCLATSDGFAWVLDSVFAAQGANGMSNGAARFACYGKLRVLYGANGAATGRAGQTPLPICAIATVRAMFQNPAGVPYNGRPRN